MIQYTFQFGKIEAGKKATIKFEILVESYQEAITLEELNNMATRKDENGNVIPFTEEDLAEFTKNNAIVAIARAKVRRLYI